MPESNQPPYIVRGGEQVFAPPFMQTDTRMQGFLVRGTRQALQAVVDRELNGPAAGKASYRVLSSHVLLAYAPIGATRSTEPPDSQKGYTPETDVAFWVLVGEGHERAGVWWLDRLAWFLPYVWVDVPTTMATGREVYGYPKELGWLTTPPADGDPLVFAMETLVLAQFEPTTPLSRKPILSVQHTGGARGPGPAWTHARDAIAAMKDAFVAAEADPVVPGFEFWVHLLAYLLRREVPMVFLKQFRDVVQPDRACYQAVIESPAKVVGLPSGGLLLGDHTVTIHDYASHPIARDLGLGAPSGGVLQIRADLAFRVEFDFLVELGRVIAHS